MYTLKIYLFLEFIIFSFNSNNLYKGKNNGVNLNESVFSEIHYIKSQIKNLKKLPIALPYGETRTIRNIDMNCICRSSSDLYYC